MGVLLAFLTKLLSTGKNLGGEGFYSYPLGSGNLMVHLSVNDLAAGGVENQSLKWVIEVTSGAREARVDSDSQVCHS